MPVIINGSTGISGTDGSAGTPAVQGTDGNTGMFFPAADQIAFAEGGVEAMRLDASGNVGIGTSSPGARLHVQGTGSSFTEMHLSNATLSASPFKIIYGDQGQVNLTAVANREMTFATNNTERARITSGGDFLFGTTTTSLISGNTSTAGAAFTGASLYVARSTLEPLLLNKLGADGNVASFWKAGSFVGAIFVNGSSTSYNTTSDYRLKANVVPLTGAAARVQALKPYRFNFIIDPNNTVDGFLAHEAAEVVPEAVTGEKDAVREDGRPVYQGIDHSKLVPLLTAALQEALTEIAALKARVAALEATP